MSTVPSGTRFIGISENVNLAERKSAVLNAETQPYTIQDIADTVGAGAQGPQGVQGPPGPPGTVSPAGLEWRGAWVSGTSYVADDAVGYDGASWFCILATSGTTAPDLATANWALLASQGAQGIQGVQGPTGPQGPAGSDTVTLQQVLDNNADLVDGNFIVGTQTFGDKPIGTGVISIGEDTGTFATADSCIYLGYSAGSSNDGNFLNAIGDNAGANNTGIECNAIGGDNLIYNSGDFVNAIGTSSFQNNTANYVNAFGKSCGEANAFKNVNLFGYEATADAENQTVFSKWISGVTKYLARLSFNNITADRKWELPDATGTIALTSQLPTVAGNYASDALAAAGGVPVGGMYHTAGVVKIRLT